MKKQILYLILFIIISFPLNSQGETVTGGVVYNVNSAREYIFKDSPEPDFSEHRYFVRTDNIERMLYSYDTDHRIIGITVLYKQDHTQAYIYDEHKNLIYVDKYDKDVNLYPHRGYRYNLDGKLILTSLSVSKNEHYRFDANGNFLAHSLNGITYDENGKIIGTSSK